MQILKKITQFLFNDKTSLGKNEKSLKILRVVANFKKSTESNP